MLDRPLEAHDFEKERNIMRSYFVVMMLVMVLVAIRFYQILWIGHPNYSFSNTEKASNDARNNSLSISHITNCLALNSNEWIQGQRRGNADHEMDDAFLQTMILNVPYMLRDGVSSILHTTLCHRDSRFRNETEQDDEDERTIRLWVVRLVYLAFHYHQHHWAIPEAVKRGDNCNLSEQSIGKFDFECPDAKFLLVPLRGHGLGANLRTDIVPALLVALVSNRVAVFVNHAPEGDEDVTKPWPLASCDRKDYQCFYLPESPCTLTLQDIREAHVFQNRVDFRRALKQSILPTGFDDKKVWLFKHTSGHTIQLPKLAVARLQNYSNLLLNHLPDDDGRLPTLRKAVESIGEEDPPRDGLNYAMANLKVHHALEFYAMRPNLPNKRKLEQILQDVLPHDFDPEYTVGLPVRGKLLVLSWS